MKTSNKKKIVVSTLALAMGAALAGSISGSVAWYQYSTRAAALIAGTSAGTSRNLQISNDAGANWSQYVSDAAVNFRPTSIVANAVSDSTSVTTRVEHPVYQYPELPAVTVNEKTTNAVLTYAYYEYQYVFKCEDTTSGSTTQVAKEVYLSSLEIVNTSGVDVTPAVRIAIDGTNDFLVSKEGGTTTTAGNLDIGGYIGRDDTTFWDCQDNEPVAAVAGSALANGDHGAADTNYYTRASSSAGAGYLNDGTNAYTFAGKGTSFVADADNTYYPLTNVGANGPKVTYTSGAASYDTVAPSSVVAGVADAYLFTNKSGRLLTTTKTGSDASEPVTIQIWLEGWQELGSETVWDTAYQNQNFEVRMQFACEADK